MSVTTPLDAASGAVMPVEGTSLWKSARRRLLLMSANLRAVVDITAMKLIYLRSANDLQYRRMLRHLVSNGTNFQFGALNAGLPRKPTDLDRTEVPAGINPRA